MEVGFGYSPAVVVLLLAFLLAMQQAPAAVPGGTLRITVLERETDVPLADTGVWIISHGRGAVGRTVRTGSDGAVQVDDLPVGRYTIQVLSETHLSDDVHSRRPTSPWPADRPDLPVNLRSPGHADVTVAAGRVQPVQFTLLRGSEISGRIVRAGRPVGGASVVLLTMTGRKVLGRPIVAGARQAKSNADGSFVFSALYPDTTYLVRAQQASDDDGSGRFNSLYYPGKLDVGAAMPIVVGANTRDELLFNLEEVRTVTVAGRVVDDREGGTRELIMRYLDEDTGDVIHHVLLPLRPDGTWMAPSTRSGVIGLLYTRKASNGRRVLAAAWRVIHVADAQLKDVNLRPVEAASMSGTFEFAGGTVAAKLDGSPSIFLRPEGVEESIRWGLHDGGGMEGGAAFRIGGIFGASMVDVTEPDGWIAEAVVLPDGRNILDQNFPFEPGRHYDGVRVILSDRVATVRGTVPAGTPLNPHSLRVIAFPEDEVLRQIHRRVKTGAVDDRGNFSISDLRPGTTYLISTCGWPCSSGPEAQVLNDLAATATRLYVDRPGVFTVTLKR